MASRERATRGRGDIKFYVAVKGSNANAPAASPPRTSGSPCVPTGCGLPSAWPAIEVSETGLEGRGPIAGRHEKDGALMSVSGAIIGSAGAGEKSAHGFVDVTGSLEFRVAVTGA